MGIRELEVLLALCNAAPLLDDFEQASQLLHQLSKYLVEAHAQAFAASPFIRSVKPSPWDTLTCELTRAVLCLGLRHANLRREVLECLTQYLQDSLHVANELARSQALESQKEADASQDIATVSASLIGFLKAAADHADFFNNSEMIDVVRMLGRILDENLMVSVEGAFSSIRTSDFSRGALAEWKLYIKRYAASGQPIGAMLLQRNFMRLLVSFSSLQVGTAEQLHRMDSFDVFTSQQEEIINGDDQTSIALVELLTECATESMRLLEDGSDYLQLGSAWQQRLASSVKANTLHTFLNCAMIDDDVADVETLMSWLEDALSDAASMADDNLAAVVLKSMAVTAKFSSAIASSLSRSLPRFIVQSGIKGDTVIIAARSLTHVLRLLSQDAVITGLYSLGNVLSARGGNDQTLRNGDMPNGNAHPSKGKTLGQQSQLSTQHSTGSAISLDMSGEEETSVAYGNIVRAVVCIAASYEDVKIAALAQSMLLQKLGRISLAVDLHIIREAAVLALAGGESEFKSLLRLYDRLCHDGVKTKDITVLEAVRNPPLFPKRC